MGFDLYFCKKDKSGLDKEALIAYFKEIPNIEVLRNDDGSVQFWYENESTGVYFAFDYIDPAAAEAESTVPEGCFDTGLSFNINYFRPTSFALEAMPLVEEAAEKLDLLVINPQDESNLPGPGLSADLIESWKRGNCSALEAMPEKAQSTPYLPAEKSLALWEYQRVKDELQKQLGDAIFVPAVFVLKEGETDRLVTATSWAQGIPQLVPECDYVVVLQEKQGFLRKKKEKGILPYKQLMAELDGYLEPFQGPVPNTMIMKPEKSAAAIDAFNNMTVMGLKGFAGISLDSFIDIR